MLAAALGDGGVLFIDDLHWADDASLALLNYLVRRLDGKPVCIVVTWRTEGVPVVQRLRALVADAQRAGRASLMRLARLSAAAVGEMVSTLLESGVEVPSGVEERLYRESEGLPFFVVEYLAAIPGGAKEAGEEGWEVPESVRDLLSSRLNAASETGRQLLSAAAVIGRSFGVDVVRAASGRSEDETVTALEELVSRGLVTETDLAYDFTHERLRSFVMEQTGLARRRLLHRRVAEALAARARGRGDLGPQASQIAYHYANAGQDVEAAGHFVVAGEQARGLFANTEALAHFRRALALGHPGSSTLHEAIGDLQTLLAEYAAALASYETAAAQRDPVNLTQLEHKLGSVHHRRGDWELAESHFEAALAALGREGPPGARARVYADWSLTAHNRDHTQRAVDLAQEALRLADGADDTRALAQAHNIMGILAKSQGQLNSASSHLELSLSLVESLGSLVGARVAPLNNLALTRAAEGDTDKAVELAGTALAICTSQGDRHHEAALHNNLSDILHLAGDTEAAMAHLKQAVTIFADIGEEAGTMQPEIWKLVEW